MTTMARARTVGVGALVGFVALGAALVAMARQERTIQEAEATDHGWMAVEDVRAPIRHLRVVS